MKTLETLLGAGLLIGLAIGCASAGLSAQESQEVYKSVDADGHVVYSDRGASKGAAKTAVA